MTSRTQESPAVGWLLLMPAALGMLITLLLPTVLTAAFSLRAGELVGPSEFVGLDNYGRLLTDATFWPALGFTLSATILPLLVALVVAPLLAFALDRGGTVVRRAGRILLSLSLVAFSPAAVAVSWLRGLQPDAGGLAALARQLGEAQSAPGAFRLIAAAATFGVVCALAVMAFLPALRGGTVTPAMLTVGVIVALATVAAGLQLFTLGLVLTGGGPMDSTQTLALLQYTYTFRAARLGMGASIATVTGVVLGVLGVAATVVAIVSRMRLTYDAGTVPRRASGAGVAVGVVALAVAAAAILVTTWPWLSALLTPGRTAAGPSVHLNTWLPALAGALVSVGVAYLAALGIGALRPLGRRSEWLLLPFAPWLFAGTGPLSIANWNTMRGLGLVDTFAALVPPLLVSVPALVVLTLLCKGLAERNTGDLLTGVVRPSLPMAGILVVAVTLVNAQDLLWPLLVAQRTDLATAPVAQMTAAGQFEGAAVDAALATPLVAIVLALAAAVAAQLLYLDRLALTVGRGTGARRRRRDA